MILAFNLLNILSDIYAIRRKLAIAQTVMMHHHGDKRQQLDPWQMTAADRPLPDPVAAVWCGETKMMAAARHSWRRLGQGSRAGSPCLSLRGEQSELG